MASQSSFVAASNISVASLYIVLIRRSRLSRLRTLHSKFDATAVPSAAGHKRARRATQYRSSLQTFAGIQNAGDRCKEQSTEGATVSLICQPGVQACTVNWTELLEEPPAAGDVTPAGWHINDHAQQIKDRSCHNHVALQPQHWCATLPTACSNSGK